MSLLRLFKVQGPIAATAVSFVEMILFFCGISLAYFALMCALYVGPAARWAGLSLEGVGYGDWPYLLPVWMWIVTGVLYLLLITLYWVPGDEETNRAELRGFVLFLVAAAAVGAIYVQVQYGLVSETFAKLFGTVSGSP